MRRTHPPPPPPPPPGPPRHTSRYSQVHSYFCSHTHALEYAHVVHRRRKAYNDIVVYTCIKRRVRTSPFLACKRRSRRRRRRWRRRHDFCGARKRVGAAVCLGLGVVFVRRYGPARARHVSTPGRPAGRPPRGRASSSSRRRVRSRRDGRPRTNRSRPSATADVSSVFRTTSPDRRRGPRKVTARWHCGVSTIYV